MRMKLSLITTTALVAAALIGAPALAQEGEGQRNPYCLAVIPPKLMKLRKSFQDKVKA